MNGKAITLVGSIATAIWLLLIAVYVWAKWSCFLTMDPNSLGDFVAGAFGPLALFWLVCGYFQQGLELRQNTEALNLQVEELRNSVLHQGEMARASMLQLELEKAKIDADALREQALRDQAAPKLQIQSLKSVQSYAENGRYGVQMSVKNLGDDLELLEVEKNGIDGEVHRQGNWKSLQTVVFSFKGPRPQHTAESSIKVKMKDVLAVRHEVVIKLTPEAGKFLAELGSPRPI